MYDTLYETLYRTPKFWPPAPELRRTNVTLNFRDKQYPGYLVTPAADQGSKPLVLVIHNYQGMKFFDGHVAEYLARIGYAGLAIDLYGDQVSPDERLASEDEKTWQHNMKKCFSALVALEHDHAFFRALLGAWLDEGLRQPGVDATVKAGAIGYCLGGAAVLEAVRGGLDLAGVVSFHGVLQTGEGEGPSRVGIIRPPVKPCPNQHNNKTIVQIENGADDHLVTPDNRARFFKEMNDAGIDWIFNDYANTPHGFALPPTIGPPGHLHEAADRRSTLSMLNLFKEIFPGVPQATVEFNASGTRIPA